jgi:hypothetical protein
MARISEGYKEVKMRGFLTGVASALALCVALAILAVFLAWRLVFLHVEAIGLATDTTRALSVLLTAAFLLLIGWVARAILTLRFTQLCIGMSLTALGWACLALAPRLNSALFSANSGQPRQRYLRDENGHLRLFPGGVEADPQSGVHLAWVTQEVAREYARQQGSLGSGASQPATRAAGLLAVHRDLLDRAGFLDFVLRNVELIRYWPWPAMKCGETDSAVGCAQYADGQRIVDVAVRDRDDLDVVATIVHEAAHLAAISQTGAMASEEEANAVSDAFVQQVLKAAIHQAVEEAFGQAIDRGEVTTGQQADGQQAEQNTVVHVNPVTLRVVQETRALPRRPTAAELDNGTAWLEGRQSVRSQEPASDKELERAFKKRLMSQEPQ